MITKNKIIIAGLLAPTLFALACKSAETPPPETKPVAAVEAPKKVEVRPVGQVGAANQMFSKGDYKSAIGSYDQILAQEPENEVAQFNRAVALQKSGDLQGAKQAYHAILKKNEDDV